MASAEPGKDDGLKNQPNSESEPQYCSSDLTNLERHEHCQINNITVTTGGRLGTEILDLGR